MRGGNDRGPSEMVDPPIRNGHLERVLRFDPMEVVIGVQLSTRELRIDVADNQADTLRKEIEKVFSDAGNGRNPVLWITDSDGRTIGVPADKLAYVEIGSDKGKQIGFAAS